MTSWVEFLLYFRLQGRWRAWALPSASRCLPLWATSCGRGGTSPPWRTRLVSSSSWCLCEFKCQGDDSKNIRSVSSHKRILKVVHYLISSSFKAIRAFLKSVMNAPEAEYVTFSFVYDAGIFTLASRPSLQPFEERFPSPMILQLWRLNAGVTIKIVKFKIQRIHVLLQIQQSLLASFPPELCQSLLAGCILRVGRSRLKR